MTLVFIIAGYLAGSIPFGLWLVKMVKGVDVRKFGSGNTGTINVFRVGGAGLGTVVFILDVLKGFGPVWLGSLSGLAPAAVVLVGLAAIAGHNWSLYLKFSGGKGVATSLGVLIALSWQTAVLGFAVWLIMILLTRYSSVGSMSAGVAAPLLLWWLKAPPAYVWFGVVAAVFILYRHRANIQRLANGTELKISLPGRHN